MDAISIELMQARIAELEQEYLAGGSQLRALEARQRQLQDTLLRISGAIQVMQELVQQASRQHEA